MAVEDDPRWPMWKRALEKMLDAKRTVDLYKGLTPNKALEDAETELELAKANYRQIADRL